MKFSFDKIIMRYQESLKEYRKSVRREGPLVFMAAYIYIVFVIFWFILWLFQYHDYGAILVVIGAMVSVFFLTNTPSKKNDEIDQYYHEHLRRTINLLEDNKICISENHKIEILSSIAKESMHEIDLLGEVYKFMGNCLNIVISVVSLVATLYSISDPSSVSINDFIALVSDISNFTINLYFIIKVIFIAVEMIANRKNTMYAQFVFDLQEIQLQYVQEKQESS